MTDIDATEFFYWLNVLTQKNIIKNKSIWSDFWNEDWGWLDDTFVLQT